ncbi:hypothetical protein [Mariniluteicoccus endophyticus]
MPAPAAGTPDAVEPGYWHLRVRRRDVPRPERDPEEHYWLDLTRPP